MPAGDWIVGGDRCAAGAERIYAAASDLIAKDGLNSLDIHKLATRVHCSRATIYRYVGGKSDIQDAILARTAARIVDSVSLAAEGLDGRERVVNAIVLAVRAVRSDPVGQHMIESIRDIRDVAWLAASPLVAQFAGDFAGLAGGDPDAAKWVVRIVLSLLYWPAEDDEAELRLVQRYVGPSFAGQ